MKIGELAKVVGVTTSRIRFYEKHGLLPAPDRRTNGYRDYPPESVERLRVIALSQDLGFSLAEIRRALPDDPKTAMKCDDIIDQLKTKLIAVDQHISDLRTLQERLKSTLTHFEAVKAGNRHSSV